MPSRRQFLAACSAVGVVTVPGTATADAAHPTADLDAALAAFGSGDPGGHVDPGVLPRIRNAAAAVDDEAPALAARATERLPSVGDALAADDGVIRSLSASPLRATTADPDLDGVAALTVGVDFTIRGPVVRARVTGVDGAPSRSEALDALATAGLPVGALEPFAIGDGDDLALYAGITDRDDEQGVLLALILVVLAAVVGTFVLGLGDSVRGGGGSDRPRPPQVVFSFDYRSSGALTITHDGGDTVAADQLRIRGDGVSRRWGERGTVSAGDSVTVQVPADAEVRVIWTAERGDTSATLAAWSGPEA